MACGKINRDLDIELCGEEVVSPQRGLLVSSKLVERLSSMTHKGLWRVFCVEVWDRLWPAERREGQRSSHDRSVTVFGKQLDFFAKVTDIVFQVAEIDWNSHRR
jgi:hypothetical protein